MKSLRVTVLVTLMLTWGASVSDGATSVAPTWHAAKVVALPHGGTGVPQGYLPALSCPSAGNCSAGGAYSDASGNTQGLLLDEVNGVWKPSTRLKVSNDAASNPGVTVDALACATSGNCSVVGSYQDAAGDAESFVANEVRHVWSVARRVALPSNAITTGQNSSLRSIDCPSVANCSAVGTYVENVVPIGHSDSYVISEVRGHWTNAAEVVVPIDANVNPFTSINQLSCASSGNCAGVGSYIDVYNVTHGLMVSQVNGTWIPGVAMQLPGDANAFPNADLNEVTCVSPGNCTALGTYLNVNGALNALSVVESRGRWGRATSMVMPVSAATNPHVFFYGFKGLSCPSVGNCSAGGQYRDGSGLYQGFLINEVHGTWSAASVLELPSGAQSGGKNGGVVAVSCRSAGHCSAGAAYLDHAGNYQALVVNEVAGVWRGGEEVALPSGATTVGVDGGVYALVCTTARSCTATGSFLSTASNYQGFTVATN